MNEKETNLPVLDTLIQSRELQMLKAVVPYLQESRQKMFSMAIKMIELQRTMQLFDAESEMQAEELHICSNESESERMRHMLNALREYCTPKEQETIDTIINFFDMFSSYETLFNEM